jgi:two-component system response regulator AtoC
MSEVSWNKTMKRQIRENYTRYGLVGNHPSLLRIFGEIEKVSRISGVTVLITGESGTGKELIARALHRLSYQEKRPFVEVNCSAIPENLLEAELFGHEKGAFTDAKAQRKGLLETSHGGSLFLDEIGHMSAKLQVKLLKVIEEKTFRPLGSAEETKVSVRIIAATNLDLESAVRDGAFRNDLYYRLSVFSIHLPPLRERGDDILLLAEHFLEQFQREYSTQARKFAPRTERLLLDYSWPGNVRELKNTVERAVLLNGHEVLYPEDLSIDRRMSERRHISGKPVVFLREGDHMVIKLPSQGLDLEQLERRILEEALTVTEGNLSRAAQLIGLSRDTLRYRIKKYGLTNKRAYKLSQAGGARGRDG